MGTAGLGGGGGLEVTTGAGVVRDRERLDRRYRLVGSIYNAVDGSAVWGLGRAILGVGIIVLGVGRVVWEVWRVVEKLTEPGTAN